MKTYGYVRVSTPRQDPQRQVTNILRQNPDAIIYSDKFTGASLQRPEFQKLMLQVMKDLKSGEQVTIIFDEVSRMSRNAIDGFALYQDLYNRGVDLQFIKEPHINTAVFRKASGVSIPKTGDKVDFIIEGINKFMFALAEEQIQLAFEKAQEEIERLHIRTSEGMRSAGAVNVMDEDGNILYGTIAQSKVGSHPIHKKSAEAAKIIKKHCKDFGGSLSDEEVRKLCGVARNTFYKIKRQVKESC